MARLLPRPSKAMKPQPEVKTREEALAHIHSVIFITLEQILAQGALVPVDVEIPNGTLISVEI